jgi:ubiquinone/menaquinone biosynthesis C-methylase UbiE
VADGTVTTVASFPEVARRNFFQTQVELPLIVGLLSPPRNARVLEVGCGRGVALPILARRLQPAELVGLDCDPDVLAIAQERAGGVARLVEADAREMPFEDASFDLVFDFGTFFHTAGPEKMLSEIARVLAPGGTLICETRLSQLISHPTLYGSHRERSYSCDPRLRLVAHRLLWVALVRT